MEQVKKKKKKKIFTVNYGVINTGMDDLIGAWCEFSLCLENFHVETKHMYISISIYILPKDSMILARTSR